MWCNRLLAPIPHLNLKDVVEQALAGFEPCSTLVDSLDFAEKFSGASSREVFASCEAWIHDMEEGILIEETVFKVVKSVMKLPMGKRQLDIAYLKQMLCTEKTECARIEQARDAEARGDDEL